MGTINLSTNSTFREIVHTLTYSAFNSNDENDYYTSFKSINRRYNLANHELITEMKTSLLANGGTENDAATLEDIFLGIDIDSILLETGLRLSYKDGLYPTNGIHAIAVKLLFLILPAFYAGRIHAQVIKTDLILIDSVKLEVRDISEHYNFPIIKASKDFIYYTGGDSLKIQAFDFQGNPTYYLPHEKAIINISHTHNALLPLPDSSLLFGISNKSFVHYKVNQSLPDTIKYNGNFQNKYYYLNTSEGVTDYAYATHSKTLFVPVFYFANELAHIKSPKYYRRSNKLLAVCKVEGKSVVIKDLIIDRDLIYYKDLYPHLNNSNFQLVEDETTGSKLFVNEMASPKIRIYTASGEKTAIFGEPATHFGINSVAIPNPYRLNRDKGSYLGFKYLIESPVYTFVYHVPQSNLTFRGYRSSIKDTTAYRKYKIEIKACNYIEQTPTDKAQHAALEAKPFGLQIYDAQNKLIFDEIMSRPTRNILKVEDNIIWADGRADKANNAYWIYKYQVIQRN